MSDQELQAWWTEIRTVGHYDDGGLSNLRQELCYQMLSNLTTFVNILFTYLKLIVFCLDYDLRSYYILISIYWR